ncbi:hypothetical protein FRX31_002092 [Thalictrum thalictroides]|uniref:Uncharacterized protein n=1 Tax=Thalictrum thalictroides TaxID=46969 RepID=A0A7J6XEU2_THATH|nr:hypothetical protein FRX31_002092 [Thalictrum thalictroides]
MAIQAQYMSPVLRSKNNTNVFEEFYNGNLYYNNGGGQQQFLNGTMFSEPESELTNMSGSRKRNRDDQQ